MKRAIAVLLLISLCGCSLGKDLKWKETLADCLKEFGLEEEAFLTGHVPDEKKCFFKCLKERSSVMNAAGEITVEAFIEHNPEAPPYIAEDMKICAETSKRPDSCDTAIVIAECLRGRKKDRAAKQ